ncbi:hypothetical protein SAMN05216548_102366 [Faunimonas pinastri]|uniref:Uncharacterized protein n=2 Tax=Faunimonas pinastri TaxID=1855383 RepID=A0A1H9D6L8_9HYPH|nr:hypothetical protein SAMN05216548_102366 [Faunimonas pinastri]
MQRGQFDEDVTTTIHAMKLRERAEVQPHEMHGKARLKLDVNASREIMVSSSADGIFERARRADIFYNTPMPA